jgi:hypothetical protein
MRNIYRFASVAAMAFAVALAVTGCGGGNSGGGSPAPPASGVVTVYPGAASVPADTHTQVQFSAFLAGQPSATFTWSVSGGASSGTINASTGVYTPPSSVPSPATVTVTATDSSATTETGTATITIVAMQGVTVSPAALALPAGTSATFSATASGNPVVPTWQVNGIAGGGASVGTITNTGVYTAPLTPPSGGSVTITAVNGASNGTAAATIVFSGNSLNGSYAFSYSGSDQNGPVAVAGRFTANSSSGGISILEDYNSPGSSELVQALSLSGTYQVNPDGSGSATFANPATIKGTEVWQFTLGAGVSGGASQHALLVRFDNTATASGTIDLQNTGELSSLSSVSGNYVFSLSGVDSSNVTTGAAFPIQFAGIFNADGSGNIPVNSGEEDINDGGTATANTPDLSLNGTYSLDTGRLGTGRGFITLNNTSAATIVHSAEFAFYMVDSTHLKLVEIDSNAMLSGDVYAAPSTARGSYQLSSFSGNYAFTLGGSDLNLSSAYAQGGVLTSNGNGGITGGVVDVNNGGTDQLNASVSATSYTVDPSLGRIAFPVMFGHTTIDYAAYAAANGSIQIISLDPVIMDSGAGFLQTSTSTPQGAFALNLSGVTNGSAGGEEDVAGQITIPAKGTPTGNVAINNPTVGNTGRLVAGVPIESNSSVGAAGSNGRGTASIASHLETYPLIYYTIDGNNVLLFESDSSRTMVGALARQF